MDLFWLGEGEGRQRLEVPRDQACDTLLLSHLQETAHLLLVLVTTVGDSSR